MRQVQYAKQPKFYEYGKLFVNLMHNLKLLKSKEKVQTKKTSRLPRIKIFLYTLLIFLC